jgi:hypothetical protein
VDPLESAYSEILSLKSDFARKHGKAADVAVGNDKSNAAYYLKLALRYGEMESAKRQLAEYAALGGTPAGLQESIKSLAPLGGLTQAEQKEFLASLTADEKERFTKAQTFYETVIERGGDVGPADLLSRPIPKEVRAPVDRELHRLRINFPFPHNEVSVGGVSRRMSDEKFGEFQQRLAETAYRELGDLIARPSYERLNDEEKKATVEKFKQSWVDQERDRLRGEMAMESGATGRTRLEAQRDLMRSRLKERQLSSGKDLFIRRGQIERRLRPRVPEPDNTSNAH